MSTLAVGPKTSLPHVYFDDKQLNEAAKGLSEEIKKITHIRSLTSEEAQKAAEKLREVAEKFKTSLYDICKKEVSDKSSHRPEDVLRDREIPFSLTYRIVHILALPEIQCYDALKRELSKTMLIFIEFTVFQCTLQERNLYKESRSAMINCLEMVGKTLPKHEVETRFCINCAQEGLKNTNYDEGKWKDLVTGEGFEHLKSIVISLLNFPSGTIGAIAGTIPGIIGLCLAVYKRLGASKWYNSVWLLRWYSAIGYRITTVDEFKALFSGDTPLKKILKKSEKSHYVAFCLSEILWNIFNNTKDSKLKAQVLQEGDLSLSNFAGLDPDWIGDDYVDVRYITLAHLQKAIQYYYDQKDSASIPTLVQIIVRCFEKESAKEVRALLGSIIAHFGSQDPTVWKPVIDQVRKKAQTGDGEAKILEQKISNDKKTLLEPRIVKPRIKPSSGGRNNLMDVNLDILEDSRWERLREDEKDSITKIDEPDLAAALLDKLEQAEEVQHQKLSSEKLLEIKKDEERLVILKENAAILDQALQNENWELFRI